MTAKRDPLSHALAAYRHHWLSNFNDALRHRSYDASEEQAIITKFDEFVAATPHCFERSHAAGHITGSAIVVSEDFKEVLLTLHAKLGMWLQLGGHADGHHLVYEVAAQEVREESGLTEFSFFDWTKSVTPNPAGISVPPVSPVPFDLDAHWIPANPRDPAHWHYDVRYVVVASRAQRIAITDESHDLRWFTLNEARKVTAERSMHRQFDKVEHFGAL
jgi:8-oxo-dGTP pyrophosphatase MutT (NUDIX family)